MITEFASAKVNLTLEVLGKRGDGYHELRSLVVFADFGDRLTFTPGSPLRLETVGPFAAAVDGENLVLKAARVLLELNLGIREGLFRLEKHIPVAAGLGGGSSDAAAAFRALLRGSGSPLAPVLPSGSLQAGLSEEQLTTLAASVGADVPVCLWRRTALMEGVGERLTPAPNLPLLPAVLVNPGVKLSTRDVFAELAAPELTDKRMAAKAADFVPPSDRPGLMDYLAERGNDLEAPARRLAPAIDEVFASLAARPGCMLTRLSGSGPTCFGIFASIEAATDAAKEIAARHPAWWVTAAVLG